MLHKRAIAIFILLAGIIISAFSSGSDESEQLAENKPQGSFPNPPMQKLAENPGTEAAVFAGGCFWGVEGVFEELDGVRDVVSGYSGGSSETANYNAVSFGISQHAEAVRIEFDPSVVSYATLLKVFFHVAHDPTQLNYQGPDRGTQYRSEIFYLDEAQKNLALEYIALLDKAGVFPDKIVTELSPLDTFYLAEDYHQDFMMLNPEYPYIVYWDRPKVEFLRYEYPELLKND